MDQPELDIRFVALAPTFNNAKTLRSVLQKLLLIKLPILIVNDGSEDETATILAEFFDHILVITHPENQGKAAAIRSGFRLAESRGYTHVITIDTDGQHDVSDVPAMMKLAIANPQALIIGNRDETDTNYPRSSLAGRRWSNRFVKLESGLAVSDSQSGLRIYPIAVSRIATFASRYGFETEILTRCGWANVEVIETPIKCIYQLPEGRISHFRPITDTLMAFVMHARLLLRSFLPVSPHRLRTTGSCTTGTIAQRILSWFSPMNAWRTIRSDEQERKRFALAIATGVMIANLPIYGFQTVMSLIIAKRFRLHPLAVVTGSHLSTPPVGTVLICMAVITGHWILNGHMLHWNEIYPPQTDYLHYFKYMASAFILGSMLCGLVLSTVVYFLIQLILMLIPCKKSESEVQAPVVDA